MMACRIAAVAGLLSAVAGARWRRERKTGGQRTIAGVPVQNYREGAEDWIVLFKQGTSDETLRNICKDRCAFFGHPDKGGAPFAAVHGTDKLEALLGERSASVELLEPDALDFAIPEVDMEEVGKEDSVAELASWGLDRVGVADRPSTGRGVHVYVHDTGVRVSHMDFGGRAIATLDATSGTLVECRGSTSCAADSIGHGTHCAGTVAGTTYGVASRATIHSVKTLSDSGTGQRSWNIAAIDWIASQGQRPAVSSMSLGGWGQDAAYKAAIDAATASGVTVVAAAGNFGSDTCGISPAFVPNCITVGATDSGNNRAGYSNFGKCNDIMAPGSSITSASHLGDTGDKRNTGTSMACPHVSGAAALLLEMHPRWKRDDIMEHMTTMGIKGYVSGLKPDDPDLFLWVGKEPPLGKPTCPSFTQSTNPNYWGECTCPSGQFCSLDGQNRNCPSAFGPGGTFDWKCKDCRCY